MPKRSRNAQKKTSAGKRTSHTKQKPKPRHVSKAHLQEHDENQVAFAAIRRVIELTVGTPKKNPSAVALGGLGGLKGGHVRAKRLTPEERSKSASEAAKARWQKE
jgi:hypothetical protein